MSGKRTELRSALQARQPVVFVASDGREWEFPADLQADGFLSFVEEFGEEINDGGALSLPATLAFFRMALGDGYETIRQSGLSFREMNEMAWSLYLHYMGVTPKEDGGDVESGGNPPD